MMMYIGDNCMMYLKYCHFQKWKKLMLTKVFNLA